ncbi:SLATT domain-containing protein [Planococcus donghaensis]|uniref:SMODS and SLOG-associating 2TM effector domain-containing protein n=1 Tax=Planococcus donghaensis TaxID=414778 RepID=A0A1C7EJN9_9BACL|nr:SLATT domain-containing protein [Planococcus donghaensis]ANU24194.1 hypothetical protein BCM40_12900 [Planococcus donghaensis]
MDNLNNDIIKYRDNRVWQTKKIRMNAEERMKNNSSFNNFVLNYYTFWLLTASIFQLVDSNTSQEIYVLIASIAVFGFAIYSSTADYKGKALQYKDSYTQLAHIENDLDNLLLRESISKEEKAKEFFLIKQRYISELGKHDNQTKKDYILFNKNEEKTGKSTSAYKRVIFYINLYKGVIVIFPILIFSILQLGVL